MPASHFAALRAAGLKHNDADIVRMFDTSDPDWIAKAKALKPDLFDFDAMTATQAEVDGRMGDIEREERRRRVERATTRTMEMLAGARYGRGC